MPPPGARPYVRLFTQIGVSPEAARINALQGEALERALDELCRWFVHLHGATSHVFPLGEASLPDGASGGAGQTTLAEKLAARGVTVSNYRNGSYVSQARRGTLLFGEAAVLEREAPLGIGTWWAGQPTLTTGSADSPVARLATGIGPEAQRIEVTSPAAHRPDGAPTDWPFAPSRGLGAAQGHVFSDSTRDFVSWIRLEDEIVRVRTFEERGDTIALDVDRGYFGTTATSHAGGTRVFSPVYIGSRAAARWDTGLAGPPARNDPDAALRYATKIWQGPEHAPLGDAITWLANRIKDSFGAGHPAPYFQGLNGVWLDITSTNPYNNGDLYGNPIVPWDDTANAPMAPGRWGVHQETKLRGLQAQFSTGYPPLRWMANNLLVRNDADAAPQDRLMSESGFQGGALEHWLQGTQLPEQAARWRAQMAQHFRIQAHNWPAIYWAKWNELGDDGSVERYKRFTYGALLLAYRPDQPGGVRCEYGGPFGLAQPDDFYFWDWGAPLSTPRTLEETALTSSLYERRFEHGVVLVNPGREPQSHGNVTVPPRDSVFLMSTD